jgi:DNA-binding GntR family transcriptional regulator
VGDLYFTRGCIEAEVLRELAKRGQVPENALEAVEDLRLAIDRSESVRDAVEPDLAFHRALVDALGSPRMSAVHARLMTEMQLCMAQVQAHHLLNPSEILAEHEAILHRIPEGDPERAAEAVAAHLNRACSLLVAYLDGQP